ncbi:uncharacterized protein LOC112576908 isoform X2 [Pomacea canaliculata]|uniref:uncharacterized protein LOC112576908 isoform X2 n=1 Tax=Pomacea canaliculata TaxID=400727 RepID=UPI000D72FD06|nr:uncharacterized protein LOC112576908 isoform X2 [Pomacea canaliculata]
MSETNAKNDENCSETVLPDSTSAEPDLSEDGGCKKKKETLGPWLWAKVQGGLFPGLRWLDFDKQIFSIPWRHGKNSDWSEQDTLIFKEWEKHKGRYKEFRDTPDYAAWKTRFRCALNRVKDIEPVKEMDCENGPNPFRAFQFVHRADCSSQSPPNAEIATHDISDRKEYCSSMLPAVVRGMEDVKIGEGRGQMYGSNNRIGDYRSGLIELQADLVCTPTVVPDLSCIDKKDLVEGFDLPPLSDISIDKSINSIEMTETRGTRATTEHGDLLDIDRKDLVRFDPDLSLSKISFDQNISSLNMTSTSSMGIEATAVPLGTQTQQGLQCNGQEMKVTVRFFEKPVLQVQVTSKSGCYLYYKQPSMSRFQPSLDWCQGDGSAKVEQILIPFTPGMQPEQQDKHMISLLGNMEQGFHIFSKDGDLYVQRMCKTRIYAGLPGQTGEAVMIERQNNAFKIFDFHGYFFPALEQYKMQRGPRPSPNVILALGQNFNTESEIYKKLFITITVGHVFADQLLRQLSSILPAANDTCDESMHISSSDNFDQILSEWPIEQAVYEQ